MKRYPILIVFLSCLAWAQNPPLMETNVPPSPPGTGCKPGFTPSAAGWFCEYTTVALHHLDGIYSRTLPTEVDTGDAGAGVPNFSGWSVADARARFYALYPGNNNTIASISNTAGTTTVVMNASSPFPLGVGAGICIGDVLVVTAYNACFTPVLSVTYVGNFLTQFTFAQGGSPASCSSNCGEVAFGCGDGLPGRPANGSLCKINFLVQHHQNNLSTASTSSYIASQAWANSQAPARTNSISVGLRDSIKVGTHYYHNVTSGGACVTASSDPANWSVSGSTSVDGTCTWQDDGLNALPQEALCKDNYAGTTNDANAATAGGTIININSAGAVAPPYSTLDVMTCMPIWTERPWKAWFKLFNAGANDGNGNPGSIAHYAGVAWKAQIGYLGIGMQELSEVFGFNNDKVMTLMGLTFNQYLAAFIDDYAGNSYKDNVAAWTLAGSPPFQLNTRTNVCSTCASLSQSLVYATEIVKMAKAASPNYSFGNQGVSLNFLTVNAAGTWATANTGFITPLLDQYRGEKNTVFHHLQTVTAGDCPTVAGLATIGHRQSDLVIGSSDGSITSGTKILTAASNPFTAAMVGAPWTVSGAGAAGGTLTSTVASFQNAGQVTLADNASTTVTATGVMTWKGSCATSPNNQITQGSMALWMPFAAQHGMSVFEGFNTEVLATWDPNYSVANGLVQGAQPEYADAQTDNYQTYWNNAAQGLPSSTSSTSGKVSTQGGASLQ